ncbi:porin family protein, partial [Escherichia coli]|nr:porin family protein [Escherichia coli]
GAARLRAGYAFDRFLPYVAGGVAFADMDHTLVGPLEAYRFSDTYTGWTIGAGLEYALTDNVILRSEYRYTDFGSADFAVPTGEENKVDLKSHDVRLGISYKF